MSSSANGSGSPSGAPPPLVGVGVGVGWKDKIAHVIGVWFGCGHVPYAPGHAGTIGTIPLYLLVRPYGPLASIVSPSSSFDSSSVAAPPST